MIRILISLIYLPVPASSPLHAQVADSNAPQSAEIHDQQPLTRLPKIVSRDGWRRARELLLNKEATRIFRFTLGTDWRRLGTMKRSFVQSAELPLEPQADPASPGGAVTVTLCGSWDHAGPCRWEATVPAAGVSTGSEEALGARIAESPGAS